MMTYAQECCGKFICGSNRGYTLTENVIDNVIGSKICKPTAVVNSLEYTVYTSIHVTLTSLHTH